MKDSELIQIMKDYGWTHILGIIVQKFVRNNESVSFEHFQTEDLRKKDLEIFKNEK